jgi:uncharacterized iron-regulated membrane protein
VALWLLRLLHSWAALFAFIILLLLASEASAALFNLEIEMKGKTLLSGRVRSPNFLTKVVLWLFGS